MDAAARNADDLRVGTRVEMRKGMSRAHLLPDTPPQVTADSTYQPVRSSIAWVRTGRVTIIRHFIGGTVVERELRPA